MFASSIVPVIAVAVALGQSAPDVPPPEQQRAPSGDFIYLQDGDGTWVRIPASEAAAAIEAVRQSAASASAERAEDFYLAEVSIDGELRGDFADVRASIRVEVTRDGAAYDVPLALQQAYVYSADHQGPGAASPRTGTTADEGVVWRFSGRGTHLLTLSLRVPIRRVSAGEQLQLTLPKLARGFVARCRLRISGADVVAAAREGTVLVQEPLEGGGIQFEAFVPDTRLEVSWRRDAQTQPALAQVVTSMRLHGSRDRLQLTARQQCDVEQRSIADLLIRLPSRFSVSSVRRVAGPEAIELDYSEDPDRSGWIRLNLDQPQQGRFELEWDLVAPRPEETEATFVIDGLECDEARDQRGRIAIEALDGLALQWDRSATRAVERLDVTDARAVSGEVLYEFQFLRQPFAVVCRLASVRPTTESRTDFYVWVGQSGADLFIDTRVSVLSGETSEIQFDWPAEANAAWTPASAVVDVEVKTPGGGTRIIPAVLSSETRSQGTTWRLALGRNVTGELRAVTRFERLLPADVQELTISLPRVLSTWNRPRVLHAVGAPGIEIVAADDAPSQPLSSPTVPESIPALFQSDQTRSRRLADDESSARLEWLAKPPSFAVETSVTVSPATAETVAVRQRISFEVAHTEVSSLELELPAEFRAVYPLGTEQAAQQLGIGGVRFLIDDDALMEAAATQQGVRVELPESRTGRIQIDVVYLWPLPAVGEDGRAKLVVPVIRSADAPFRTIIARVVDIESLRIDDPDGEWQPWHVDDGETAWLTLASRSAATFQIDESLIGLAQQFTIELAFLQTSFGERGEATTSAEYVIRQAPDRIRLRMPANVQHADFRWNETPLQSPATVRRLSNPEGWYLLDLPDGSRSGRLVVSYQSEPAPASRLASLRSVAFPEFPNSVWVEESIWEVYLPRGQRLFDVPRTLVPEFSWQRNGLLWMRLPTEQYARRRAGIAGDAERGSSTAEFYAFRAAGPISRAAVGAMSESLVVLVGAGMTLLLGFMIGRVPVMRNVFSLLLLVFALALAGLWYLELLQLLLQPALLGLALAAVATWFDARTRRRRWRGPRDTSLHVSSMSDRQSRSSAQPQPRSQPSPTAAFYDPVSDSAGGG